MKKTSTIKKIMATLSFCVGLNIVAFAQCNVSFTYTVGASGYVGVTNTSTGTSGSASIYWDFGSQGSANNVSSTSVTYPFNGANAITLTISDSANNCFGTSTQTVTITNALPTPPCQSAYTYTTGANGQVDFTSTSSTYTASTTYYGWNFGDNTSDNTTSPSHTFYYNGTYTVSLGVSNPYSSCGNTSSQVITISNANPIPACNSSFTYTLGASGMVSCTSNYTGNPNNIYWSFGGQGTSGVHTYPYNGVYWITCSISDSLANCISSSSNTVTITNAATMPCIANVTFTTHQDSLNTGLWDINANYSWQVSSAVWNWGDGTSTAGMNPSHTYSSPGWYNICVYVYASCGDSTAVCQNDSVYRMGHMGSGMVTVNVVNTSAGIKTNINDATIKLYPNPVADNLTLQINSNTGNTITYALYDVYGKLILNQKAKLVSGENQLQINTSELTEGVYFVHIVNEQTKNANTFKIIK
jgi:PKD repeat protein